MPILRPLTVMAIFSLMAIFFHNIFYIAILVMVFDVRSRYIDYKNYKDLKWSNKWELVLKEVIAQEG